MCEGFRVSLWRLHGNFNSVLRVYDCMTRKQFFRITTSNRYTFIGGSLSKSFISPLKMGLFSKDRICSSYAKRHRGSHKSCLSYTTLFRIAKGLNLMWIKCNMNADMKLNVLKSLSYLTTCMYFIRVEYEIGYKSRYHWVWMSDSGL